MLSFFQHTLADPVQFAGIGIHSGRAANVTLKPAPADTGVVFSRIDLGEDGLIPATGDAVCETRLGTVVGNGRGATVSTIEHLMAVFAGLGIDNVRVELDGPEAPIMDGSAAAVLAAVDEVGLRRQGARGRQIEILEPLEVGRADKRAALLPASRFEMAVEIDFQTSVIGRQSLELALDEATFRSELADARTFGFLDEVDRLRAAGLGLGAGLDNTVVIDGERVLNPELLGRPDDFVRHKALDALGDLRLAGAPIIGRYEACCAGHALNNDLVRALLSRPRAWRLVSRSPELARAV
ncbi:MAG: UDP-3-O-acyl-N-acetylglucosamine deacetylase [Caulobacteraceae bacterium]|nr:UDP-3-O-acyl-N-acetylglucosamine deacetylase [Caulobacteraceae bacterium]